MPGHRHAGRRARASSMAPRYHHRPGRRSRSVEPCSTMAMPDDGDARPPARRAARPGVERGSTLPTIGQGGGAVASSHARRWRCRTMAMPGHRHAGRRAWASSMARRYHHRPGRRGRSVEPCSTMAMPDDGDPRPPARRAARLGVEHGSTLPFRPGRPAIESAARVAGAGGGPPQRPYFSLISRRRSSRNPCAVIGCGYRLGFSAEMHEGSTSIRKSGLGCRKNGTE